jgi:hypothetical protein
MAAQIVASILGNWFILLFVIAMWTTIAKLRRFRFERKPVNAAYVAWGELLFYVVGIGFIYAGIFHAYFQQLAAPGIGWQPSPFEYELGWIEIPLGLVAAMSLWRGFEFRLAASILFVVFSFAAAAQHLQEMVCCHNYAIDNAGPVLWGLDIALPLLVLVLAALSTAERA